MLKPKVADVTRPTFALLARNISLVKFSISILAFAIHLSACSGGQPPAASVKTAVDDSPAELNRDALQPPPQPQLLISAAPETLHLSWQVATNGRTANVYSYNTLLGVETLIQGNLSPDTSSLSIDSRTARRAWHNEQFRVELCNESDCVSSARVSLNTLAAATTRVLRPSVFIQGERFAEYIAANRDASVVFATRPVQGAIQVFFHNQQQWFAPVPISLDPTASISMKAIDSSTSGDTLAALSTSDESSSNIHIIERLGESWLPIESLPLPHSMTVNASSEIKLSDHGDTVLVNNADSIVLYRRESFGWVLESPIVLGSNSTLKAITANGQFDTLHLLTQQNEQIWLESYRADTNGFVQTDEQEQFGKQALINEDQQDDQHTSKWHRTRRGLIQGLDTKDELQIVTNTDASSIIVAGWDNTIAEQRSPLIWRISTRSDATSSETGDVQIMDSLRTTPTNDAQAKLRFSSSDDLNTIALGWQSTSGGAAEITTYTYLQDDRQWHSALELPHELTRLAKQAFAHNVLLSADGETLLITTPAGDASAPSNRVGELRVFR